MKKVLALMILLATALSLWGCADKLLPNTVFSENELKDADIGVLLNSAAAVYTNGYGMQHTYDVSEAMLVDLRNGGLDCAVMDEETAKTDMKKVTGLKILSKPLEEADFRFAIARENPDLTQAVNTAIKTLNENGTLKKIVEGYLLNNGYKYESPENADHSAGTLKLATDAMFTPYAFLDANGGATGLDIDIARAVCDLLHVGLEVTVVNRDELLTVVQYGKADFALGGMTESDENKKIVDFSDPYVRCTLVIVVRR